MPRIVVGKDGQIAIPPLYRERYGLDEGKELILEGMEDGLALRVAAPDVRKVYLEVTTRCNLHCATCVRNVWDEPLKDMDEETFGLVLEQMRALPELREVNIGGYGEPFYHPRIMDMLREIKALGVRVTVSTNGLLIGGRADELIGLVDRLVVSIDGVKPETYEGIRRGSDLSQVLANIAALNEAKRRRGSALPRVGIEFVAMRRNADELPALLELADSIGASFAIVTNLLPHTEEMMEEVLYSRDGDFQLPISIGWPVKSGDWLLWGVMELPRMSWGAERRCRFIAGKALVIGWDGGVSPCYALMHSYPYYIFGRRKQVTRYTLGNVHDSTLAEIWTSEDYVRFRAQVRDFRFPSCVDCDLRDTCDLREINEGCWGWNPSCADCLWAQDIVRCP